MNSTSYTGKIENLATLNIKNIQVEALKNDQVKVIDKRVEAQMDAAKVRYVASTTTSGNFTTNGTATLTASVNMNAAGVKSVVDYMMGTMLVPPMEGGDDYMAICTVTAFRGIHDSLESIWQYTKYPVNGEVGKYYNVRFVRDTNSMDNAIGTSNITGEAYFFGKDAVMEAVALPEELRFEIKDLGRDKRIGWIAILGFELIWQGDPDNRVVKWDSA